MVQRKDGRLRADAVRNRERLLAAARTSRIRLTSAVTVLSTDDPVRVFEQFTALDLASRGRAEVMARPPSRAVRPSRASMDAARSRSPGPPPTSEIAQFLRTAKPLTPAAKMRYPASERWHFERQRHHLDGYLVMGDALCGFNPTYGQGMSVAAMQALVLRDLTVSGGPDLPARFYRAAAKAIDQATVLSPGHVMRVVRAGLLGHRTPSVP